jgi:hypothetical protein
MECFKVDIKMNRNSLVQKVIPDARTHEAKKANDDENDQEDELRSKNLNIKKNSEVKSLL